MAGDIQNPVYGRNAAGNDTFTFKSNINIDNGHTNRSVGTRRSDMELFRSPGGVPQVIEWVVDDGEFVEHIGLEIDGTLITGYDGVFELGPEVCDWLETLGYDAKEVRP